MIWFLQTSIPTKIGIAIGLITANFCYFPLIAQDRIAFIDNDFTAALALAEQEDKLVFIDGYATWCIPCKVMEEEVFVMPEVSAFFNEHFINVKVDLEKGIGPILSARYQADVLPAYFFITYDETLIYSFAGQQKIADLMQHAHAAQNPDLIEKAWDARYAEGDRKPGFLYRYAHAKYPSADGLHQRLVKEYLETQDDWASTENIKFIYHFVEDVESPMFDFIVKEKRKFQKVIPPNELDRTIDLLVGDAIHNRHSAPSLTEVSRLLKRSYSDGEKRFLAYKIRHFRQQQDDENFALSFVKYHHLYETEFKRDSLLSMSKYILDNVHSTKAIKGAYGWTEKIARREDQAKYNYLAGQLAQKAHDFKTATKQFKRSLKKERKSFNDPEVTATYKQAISHAKSLQRSRKNIKK